MSNTDHRKQSLYTNHDFAAGELSGHRPHPYWQQTLAGLAQNLHRAVVESKLATNLQLPGEPLFARHNPSLRRPQAGADNFTGQQAQQHFGFAASGDNCGRA